MKKFVLFAFVIAFTYLFAGNFKKANISNGKSVYNKVCFACHKDGVAGAAALTNKKRWQEMADKGAEKLTQSVITGVINGKYGTMPPKGACNDCSDQDIYDGIHYMIKESGTKLK